MVMQRGVDAWMTFPDLVLLIVIVSVVGPGNTADRGCAWFALWNCG